MDTVAAAKEIANEATQLAETLEQAGGESTGTTNYSSTTTSTTSCEVDPTTGVVTLGLEVKLYPGPNPIEPEPTPEPPAAEPIPPAAAAVAEQELPPGSKSAE